MFTPNVTAPHSLSRLGLRGRRALRRFLYSQMALRTGAMVALGREDPLVRFTVEADPPSVYLVFRVPDPAALEAHLDLPAGMHLAPIRCLADDEPEHLLTLNVYRVSGITNGLRAEWSAYIADPEGVPRYLVVDARSSGRSMDPVDVITPASRVEHRRDGDRVTTLVGPDGAAFRSDLSVAGAERVRTHPEFTSANDWIYWRNGVADRTFYDAGLADADQVLVAPEAVQVADGTEWARFVEPTPWRTLVFGAAIEFVVSPWANIGRLGGA